MIENPGSLIELFGNIKEIIDQSLLSHEEFYEETKICSTFGASHVLWASNLPENKNVKLAGFERVILPTIYENGFSVDGVRVSFGAFQDNGSRKTYIRILLESSKNDVGFEFLEGLFGRVWKIDVPAMAGRVYRQDAEYIEGKHPMANSIIKFDFQQDGFARVEFNENGIARTFDYEGVK